MSPYTKSCLRIFLNTTDIGGGLFIQHGFSTDIGAKKNGRNCWINQMVCVGHTAAVNPTIGDNVTIGAGATVHKDLPSGSLAVPQSARIIENHIVKRQ